MEKNVISLLHRVLKEGQMVAAGKGVAPNIGNAMYLSDIPLGSLIHNIELNPGKGGVGGKKRWFLCTINCQEIKSMPSLNCHQESQEWYC